MILCDGKGTCYGDCPLIVNDFSRLEKSRAGSVTDNVSTSPKAGVAVPLYSLYL